MVSIRKLIRLLMIYQTSNLESMVDQTIINPVQLLKIFPNIWCLYRPFNLVLSSAAQSNHLAASTINPKFNC